MELNTITEIEKELTRFKLRLDATKKRLKEDSYAQFGCKETGALKRAALDLKNELTKITR